MHVELVPRPCRPSTPCREGEGRPRAQHASLWHASLPWSATWSFGSISSASAKYRSANTHSFYISYWCMTHATLAYLAHHAFAMVSATYHGVRDHSDSPQTLSSCFGYHALIGLAPLQDAYMPKDASKQSHRGIGFVTFASSDSVEAVMSTPHSLNGQELAIDRATPKDKVCSYPPPPPPRKGPQAAL